MPVFEDLSGQKIGYLTIVRRAPDWIQPSGQHKRMWHCVCTCGKECDVRASDLKSGNTTSCGCMSSRKRSVGLEDLTGKIFGDFLVIGRAPNKITPSGQQTRVWHCVCVNCKRERNIQASQLKSFSGKCICRKSAEKAVKKVERNERRKQQRQEKSRIKRSITEAKKLLINKNPRIAEEWDSQKNYPLDINNISANSSLNVWWIGKCGHEWKARVYARTKKKGTGCPYCYNRKLLKGFNDIATRYPELLAEWDFDNNDKQPDEVYSLNTVVFWKCSTGHSYPMRIASKVGKQKCGCPYCSIPAKKVLKGFNDLATTNPHVLDEWDYEKNIVRPDEVLAGSSKKVLWRCNKGHSFEQSIIYKVKANLDSTCPYCSHQKLLKGYNDFLTEHPELAKEWDFDKNNKKPEELMSHTHYKAWWKCPFGHSYQAWMDNRCGDTHTGCPICDKENHTSFPEQALYYYVKRCFPDAINSDKSAIGLELDIFIPSKKVAIEYDGKNWHKNNKHELKKNVVCRENNIMLIRIREEGLDLYDNCFCVVRHNVRSDASLSDVIQKVIYGIDNTMNIDVDVERDASVIYGSYIITRKEQSLERKFPELSKEWHPTKNGVVSPNMVAPFSQKKVWWLGKCGHEWLMSIRDRTHQKCGCPFCSGKRVLVGFNDFESWCNNNEAKDLLGEWDYEKNTILPSEVSKSSDKQVYWKCSKCSFGWRTKIDSRTRMKSGCPKCANRIRNQKAVKNLDTNKIYESINDAADELNINRHSIGNVCRGKQKKAGGYKWAFYED